MAHDREVGLSLRKKEHIFRYHGLSHPLLQKNAWKPPAGNCFARCPVSGALSWLHPVSQSVPKNHPKRLHTLRPVPARTPVFPVTDGKIPCQEHRYRTHQHGNKYQQRFQEAAQAEEQAAQKEKGMDSEPPKTLLIFVPMLVCSVTVFLTGSVCAVRWG